MLFLTRNFGYQRAFYVFESKFCSTFSLEFSNQKRSDSGKIKHNPAATRRHDFKIFDSISLIEKWDNLTRNFRYQILYFWLKISIQHEISGWHKKRFETKFRVETKSQADAIARWPENCESKQKIPFCTISRDSQVSQNSKKKFLKANFKMLSG